MILARRPEVIIELRYGDDQRAYNIERELQPWQTLASRAGRPRQAACISSSATSSSSPARGSSTPRAGWLKRFIRRMMKTLVSWSSGKDSAWLVHALRQTPNVEIGALLTTVNEIGRSCGDARRPRRASRGTGRRARTAAVAGLRSRRRARMRSTSARWPMPSLARGVGGFTQVAFGDLFLEDVRRYREEKLAGSD